MNSFQNIPFLLRMQNGTYKKVSVTPSDNGGELLKTCLDMIESSIRHLAEEGSFSINGQTELSPESIPSCSVTLQLTGDKVWPLIILTHA